MREAEPTLGKNLGSLSDHLSFASPEATAIDGSKTVDFVALVAATHRASGESGSIGTPGKHRPAADRSCRHRAGPGMIGDRSWNSPPVLRSAGKRLGNFTMIATVTKGEDDQIVPISASAPYVAKIVDNGTP